MWLSILIIAGAALPVNSPSKPWIPCAAEQSEVWLQVRDDNPPAIDLYRSLGFQDQAARTTWRIRPRDLNRTDFPNNDARVTIRRRVKADWPLQQAGWKLPTPGRSAGIYRSISAAFRPALLQSLANSMEDKAFKHWSISVDGACQGVITWQKTSAYAHNLWLALPLNMKPTAA
jgi:hypothetical protein